MMSDESTNQLVNLGNAISGMCWGYTQMICPTRGTRAYDELCRNDLGVTNSGEGSFVWKFYNNVAPHVQGSLWYLVICAQL